MQGTAIAHSNIALIKYWGKRDEENMLPANSSLSMTLDLLYTTTTVSFDPFLRKDHFIFNHEEATEKERLKISRFLDQVRILTHTHNHATVTSENTMPTGAGLASSASGFAALAGAAVQALDFHMEEADLSRLARLGSGSACRSIYGGFVEWQKGCRTDGTDSYAMSIADQGFWDLVMIVICVSTAKKGISSREGMKRTVQTSPFYEAWLSSAEQDLAQIKKAIRKRDFDSLGRTAEENALKMHALTLGAEPPFLYWEEETIRVIRMVQSLRQEGVPVYFTIDAGPNVVVLCESPHASEVREAVSQIKGVKDVLVCHPGPGMVCYKGEAT